MRASARFPPGTPRGLPVVPGREDAPKKNDGPRPAVSESPRIACYEADLIEPLTGMTTVGLALSLV